MTPARFYRFLPWWLLVPAVAVFLAWQYRVELAGWSLDRLLATDDTREWEIQPSEIHWDRLNLSRISFVTGIAGGRYRVVATDVTAALVYDRGPVPVVDRLVIDDLVVTQVAAAPPSNRPRRMRCTATYCRCWAPWSARPCHRSARSKSTVSAMHHLAGRPE